MKARSLCAAVPLFFVACGGAPFSIDLGAGDDGGSSANGDDGGANGVGSSTADGASPSADASTSDAGPTPGAVACGATTCASPQICCVLADGTATCQARTAACAGGRLACDEPSDCAGGACCYTLDTAVPSAECRSDCNGGDGRVRACRAPSDCTSGACAVHACATGAPIESCGPLPPACP